MSRRQVFNLVRLGEGPSMRGARVVKDSSGRSVVELQEATETLAASHGPVLAHLFERKEEEVVLPLVIPLAVEGYCSVFV